MSNRNLAVATTKLAKYFGLYTLKDLAADLASNVALGQVTGNSGDNNNNGNRTNSDSNSNPQPVGREVAKLIELLIDTTEGGLTTTTLISRLQDFSTNTNTGTNTGNNTTSTTGLNDYIKIYYAGSQNSNGFSAEQLSILDLFGGAIIPNPVDHQPFINRNPNTPSKQYPGLSIIQVNHCQVTPATKNTNALTIFMNGLPNTELARAVPYLDIQFQFARPPLEPTTNRVQTMSILKFLNGAEQYGPNTTNNLLANATTVTASVNGNTVKYATAGMELFFSPQTMVNADEIFDETKRSTAVLDKFRPFMSLKQLILDVQPAGGLMSFKSGKLEFILHDKSRLSEIADFVSPNLYGQTELLIEYGWAHPDTVDKGNYFADLINGMRTKEKYGIINSSFAFDDNGQVQITLQIAMRGSTEFRLENIGDGDDRTQQVIRQIEATERAIADLRRQRESNHVQGTREIRGIQILDAGEDARSNLVLSPDLRGALREFLDDTRRAAGGSTLSQLRQQISILFQNGGNSTGHNVSLVEQLQHIVRQDIQTKFNEMHNTPDPFLVNDTNRTSQGSNGGVRQRGRSNNGATPNDSYSLGKILLYFVAQPIAMTHKFDDIQLLFYPFNASAGFAHDKNISQFKVNKAYFINQYSTYRLNHMSRNGNMQIRDFLNFIATTIIDDLAAESYGLGVARYVTRGQGNQQTVTSEVNLDAVQMQNQIDARMRNITPDGTFKMPQVDFYIECIPEDPKYINEAADTSETQLRSILRIHVFDRQNTAFETEAALLKASRSDILSRITNPDTENQQNGTTPALVQSRNQLRQQALSRAINEGIIRRIDDNSNNSSTQASTNNSNDASSIPPSRGVYVINGGPKAIKEFIMKTTPYVIHGVQGTAVKHAALSSMQEPALTTINLMRTLRASPIEPNGERPGGTPLRIIPCELSMTTFGCPIIDFAQQLFVDFETGTTVDNIYAVTGLNHTISPGSFTTELKMTPLDAYGQYESLTERLGIIASHIDHINDQQSQGSQASRTGNTNRS